MNRLVVVDAETLKNSVPELPLSPDVSHLGKTRLDQLLQRSQDGSGLFSAISGFSIFDLVFRLFNLTNKKLVYKVILKKQINLRTIREKKFFLI
jgi:hypothetical protein